MRVSLLRLGFVGTLSLLLPSVSAHSEAPDGISYITEIENLKINTRSEKVNHLSNFDLTFHLHNQRQRIRLDLEPNHNIFGDNAHVQYLDSQGNIRHSEEIQRHEHKVFKGVCHVETESGEWDEVGWARIYLQQDGTKPLMEGSFSVQDDVHHIQLRSAYSKVRRRSDIPVQEREEESMIVYRASDMDYGPNKRDSQTGPSCGSDDLAFNFDAASPLQSRATGSVGSFYSPKKRQSGNIGTGNLRATIGQTNGCPTEERVALLGIATDCTYTASFTNEQAVRANLIQVVNSASATYERQFNIALGLRNVTISEAECPASPSAAAPWNLPCSQGTIETRLDSFSQWRGGLGDDNAYWTMMSTCATQRSVGLAWLGQICVSRLTGYGGQSVSGANVVVRTPGEWQVFAHESAHTFGAVHDCDSTLCASSSRTSSCCPISATGCDAQGQYLMSPVSGRGLSDFSPCTVGNVCSGIGRNRVRDSCLVPNRNLTTITGSQCGNGIVEAGEDCDCGPTGCGSNACCDAATCRFIGDAVCDDNSDTCCTSCQFTPAGSVCRSSAGECDTQETCSGTSATCPQDTYLPNGQSCGGGNGLACASGQCTSRDFQCASVYDTAADQNYTAACRSSQNQCTLICQTVSSTTSCAALDQNFVDGTPCSNGNFCNNGRCGSSSSDNDDDDSSIFGGGNNGSSDVRSWFDRNRSLVIGLAAGLGGLLVLIILSCCISSCRKSRKRKQLAAMPPRPMMQQPTWGAYPPPVYAPPRGGGGGAPPSLPPRAPTFRYA